LPDLVSQLLSRVAELEVDGPELLRLGHVHDPLHQLADRCLNLRAKLFHDGIDALFAGFVGVSGQGTCSHDQLLGEESVWISNPSSGYHATRENPTQVTAAHLSGTKWIFLFDFARTIHHTDSHLATPHPTEVTHVFRGP
jgi:hypothetical protein